MTLPFPGMCYRPGEVDDRDFVSVASIAVGMREIEQTSLFGSTLALPSIEFWVERVAAGVVPGIVALCNRDQGKSVNFGDARASQK
jgi:hypothetical protein